MKRIINIISSLTFCLLLQAQVPQAPTNLQSPNAASLGLYGEVPVSLFTGIPEISIPIFTAPDKYNGFSMGLSYHAGGVRPDQHPGWVGTNWTLMAGGCITRLVKGLCDELKPLHSLKEYGFYFKYSILTGNEWNTTQSITDKILQNPEGIDMSPDEFSFSFGDYYGKFYLNEKREWVVQCNKPVKVIFDENFIDQPKNFFKNNYSVTGYNQRSKTFNSFTIIAEDGSKFIFGNSENSIEYSISFWGQTTDYWIANSWFLSRIEYPTGKTINFNYQRGDYISQMTISAYRTFNNDAILKYKDSSGNNKEKVICHPEDNPNSIDINRSYDGALISPVYLSTIESQDFIIEFEKNKSNELTWDNDGNNNIYRWIFQDMGQTNPIYYLPYLHYSDDDNSSMDSYYYLHNKLVWYKLNSIKIYDIRNQLYNQFFLQYNDDKINGAVKERLFLMGIKEGVDIGNEKQYIFNYDNKENLPLYLANKTDHWGFFNNTYNTFNWLYGTDGTKETNEDAMKYGSLIKITYPTGGTTEFNYEANRYSKQLKIHRWNSIDQLDEDKLCGGLRINKIINNFNNGSTPQIKDYLYVDSLGNSSGVLGGQAQYSFKYSVVTKDWTCNFCGIIGLTDIVGDLHVSKEIFSTQSVLPACINSLGNHVGYSEVIEKLTDNSYNRYKFSNFDNGYLDESADNYVQYTLSQYNPYNSKSIERGLLLSKEVYNSSNKKVSKTESKYIKSNSNYIRNISGLSELYCSGMNGYFVVGTAYKIYTYSMLLESATTTNYDKNDNISLSQIVNYSYNNYNQVISENSQNSNGKLILTKIYYPNEIKNGILPNINAFNSSSFANSAVEVNCLNPVIATESFTNNRFTKGIYNDYQLKNKLPLLKNVHLSNSDNSTRTIYTCNNFDGFGNPLSIIENNAINSTYLWSYNGQYPIAKIKNASYADVQSALGYNDSQLESLSTNSNPDVNAIRAKLDTYFANKQALITSYTYKPLIGMTSAKDPRGVITRYFYDPFGRLSLTKDQNLNIDKTYKYAYYNSVASTTNTQTLPMSISITKNDQTYINTPTTANATVTGGTGNFGFNWYLKNINGTVIQNALDVNSQFTFTCPTTGLYTLQSDVTDYLSGDVLSTTKPITCEYPPLVVSQINGGPGYLMTTPPYNALYYSASVAISGGSPSKYCTWRLFDSYPNGNLIDTSNASTTFTNNSATWNLYSAPYTTTQTLVLQVRDNILGTTITVTKKMVKQ